MFSSAPFFETADRAQKRVGSKRFLSLLSEPFARARDAVDERAIAPAIARHLSAAVASGRRGADSGPSGLVGREDVLALAEAGLNDDPARARGVIAQVRGRGAPWTDVALALFQPAFRELGECWRRDERSFVEVGLATTILQTIYRAAACEEDLRSPPTPSDRCCMMVRLNENRHTSGAQIIADLMRKAGWDVAELGRDDGTAGEAASAGWYDLACISLSQKEDLTFLEKVIGEVRRMSRNPGIAILVGGPAFVNHPDLSSSTAADAVAMDGRDALGRADALWAERGSRMESVKRG